MSDIPGALVPTPVQVVLIGRPSIRVTLQGDNLVAVPITNDYSVEVAVVSEEGDDIVTEALFTKSSTAAGQVLVLAQTGTILIVLSDANRLLLSPQHVYQLVVRLLSVLDSTAKFVGTYPLIPLDSLLTKEFSDAMSSLLSTAFVNTLSITDYVGGAGYLDGIATVNQTVGCWIEFRRGNAQPETWELCVWTDASMNTDPGVYQQPLDFNAVTNAKVWVRRA